MRYKLVVPWTSRLSLSRWIHRRNNAFAAAVAGDQAGYKVPAYIEKH